MIDKVRDKISGKRIVLKRTTPDITLAQIIFNTIEQNRKHLEPWLPWVEGTQKAEDTFKYLIDKEEKFNNKEKIEYGIYLKNQYLGNIALFGIDAEHKSGEIGYWISAEHSGKGYMTEAVELVEKEFFNKTKINRITLKCDELNHASNAVAKKCGYKLEGIHREDKYSKHFKEHRNTATYSKLRSDFKKEQK